MIVGHTPDIQKKAAHLGADANASLGMREDGSTDLTWNASTVAEGGGGYHNSGLFAWAPLLTEAPIVGGPLERVSLPDQTVAVDEVTWTEGEVVLTPDNRSRVNASLGSAEIQPGGYNVSHTQAPIANSTPSMGTELNVSTSGQAHRSLKEQQVEGHGYDIAGPRPW